MFDILERAIDKLKTLIGYKRNRNHSLYKFSFRLESGDIVDVLQSSADPELIWFEVAEGTTAVNSNDFFVSWLDVIYQE